MSIRSMAALRGITAAACIAGALATVPVTGASAASTATAKPTSPAAARAPFVALRHTVLLKAKVKAKGAVSFRAAGLAGVPTTASAVVLSVAVAAPTVSGTLTVFSYGLKRPGIVSLAFGSGRGASSTVVVPTGNAGRAALYNASSKGNKVTVNLLGYYAAPGTPSAAQAKTRFVPVRAKRVDSVALGASKVSTFATGVPANRVSGVVLSVTVTAAATAGSVSLYPHGTKPGHGTLAFKTGQPDSSLVIVPPGSKGRIDVLNRSKGTVRVWVEVTGYLQTLAAPSPPRAVAATAQNQGALVTWLPPISDGGAPVSSYRVQVLPGGSTAVVDGEARAASIAGLRNGSAYTFVIVAMNSAGVSRPSAASAPVIPYGVPAAPSGVTAKPTGLHAVLVSWAAPTDTGGLAVTGYTVTTTPGGATTTTTATSVTISGVGPGQGYTFSVTTMTAGAVSLPSAPSNVAIGEGTSKVSVALTAEPNNVSETHASFSADGRYVAFDSDASNLTSDDRNTYYDVFVRDRLLGTTTLVSAPLPGGAGSSNDSTDPSISADGRYVAFQSSASNLVSPPTSRTSIFVRDLVTGTTRLISVNPTTGMEANGNSYGPRMSADGSSVLFESGATDLVGDDNNVYNDVFEATLATHTIRIVSRSSTNAGADGDSDSPAVSSTGRYVAFASVATNLTGQTTGAHLQIFVRDVASGTTTMISTASPTAGGNGNSYEPSISADGDHVTFESLATDLTAAADTNTFLDVYERTVSAGTTRRISLAFNGTPTDGGSAVSQVSADGRYVAFQSQADNVVVGDTNMSTDVFRFDGVTGATTLVSTSTGGLQGNDVSLISGMSGDGQHVSFYSAATNFDPPNANGYADEFVSDLG